MAMAFMKIYVKHMPNKDRQLAESERDRKTCFSERQLKILTPELSPKRLFQTQCFGLLAELLLSQIIIFIDG